MNLLKNIATVGGRPAAVTKQYWLRLGIFAAVVSALAAICLLVILIRMQLRVFVTPYRNAQVDAAAATAALQRPVQDISLTTGDGLQLAGWYSPGAQPQAVIVVHGINANRMAVLPEASILAGAGYHLLLLDLRGHGRSQGDQLTYGYREALDVLAAIDYLDRRPEVEQIAALGTSFGGAAVARAAALDPRLQAVIIESSYSSLPDAVDDAFDNLSFFPRQPFAPLLIGLAERRVGVSIRQVDSARDLATLSPRAVMIIHGNDDTMFPPRHAQKMYDAAGEPKELWLIEGLGHGNPAIEHEAEFRARVLSFLERAFAGQGSKTVDGSQETENRE
ncbi:MAG: alpha/beta fold hydrolase [Chloroflexota bacterium]